MDGSKSSYTTKDSGVRAEFASGMVRDTEAGKARFDLLFPLGIPYGQQILTRFAELMERGAVKYEERNWEKADGQVEYDRMKRSALRHMIQWFVGETDEDHAAAVMFNIMAAETTKVKMQQQAEPQSWSRTCHHDPLAMDPLHECPSRPRPGAPERL